MQQRNTQKKKLVATNQETQQRKLK
jgi:hypothetical protein